MYSLYSAILAQHFRQLTPVRCAEQTIAQLHRYFEDVVLENSLAALVVEPFVLSFAFPVVLSIALATYAIAYVLLVKYAGRRLLKIIDAIRADLATPG